MELSAESDLLSILGYISDTLKKPEIAKHIYMSIREKISTLAEMPLRNKVVSEEPYLSMGVRLLYVENYTVFYDVDEDIHKVHVLRVLYNRRQWQNLL
jgi:plasmid stabilization system protein ParE